MSGTRAGVAERRSARSCCGFRGVLGLGRQRRGIWVYCGGKRGDASGSGGLQAAEAQIVSFLGMWVIAGGKTGRLDGGKKRDLALWEGSAC